MQKGKNALLPTGSTDGMGLATAKALAKEGCNAFPGMISRRWGRIINTSPGHGMIASSHEPAYIAAKHRSGEQSNRNKSLAMIMIDSGYVAR